VCADRTTVVVGKVGRPHGVRGDVSVEVRTDEPERRFAPGTVLLTEAPGLRPGATGSRDAGSAATITVAGHRWHSGRLLLHIEGVEDREGAESLRGTLLSVDVDPAELPSDPDEFYDHQLIGLSVVDATGARLGEISAVTHGAQDLLVVLREGQGDLMVPFVRELVPEVDLDAGRVVTDLPDGLLDLTNSDTQP
jgi:16S rRNA processing protein RimM